MGNNCLPSRRLIVVKRSSLFFVSEWLSNDVNLIDRVQVVTCRFMIVNLLLRYNNITFFSSLQRRRFSARVAEPINRLTDLRKHIPLLEF